MSLEGLSGKNDFRPGRGQQRERLGTAADVEEGCRPEESRGDRAKGSHGPERAPWDLAATWTNKGASESVGWEVGTSSISGQRRPSTAVTVTALALQSERPRPRR